MSHSRSDRPASADTRRSPRAPRQQPRPGSGSTDPDIFAILDGLRQINQELRIFARLIEQEPGMSAAQLFVLEQLAEAPVGSLNDLAARTFTRHSSVSVIVSRLVELGLVERSTPALDARRTSLALTAAGRRVLRQAPASVQARLVESLRRLSRGRRAELAAGLRLLVEGLTAGAHPAGRARAVANAR